MLSPASTLIWFLAEFEALAADYPETTPWHFLVASFKLCDLDMEEFLRSAPEEAQKKRQEIMDDAQGLKEDVERRCGAVTMARRRLRQALGKGRQGDAEAPLHRTAEARAVFDRAATLAHFRNDKLRPVDLFNALLEWVAQAQHEGKLAEFADDMLLRLQHPPGHENEPGRSKVEGHKAVRGVAPSKKQPQKSALAFFGRDITELARRGKLEPVIGRRDEILRVARILSQKRKANPVLVGEPGVGKTGVVEGLAQRIASRECPEFLRDARIVEISMSALARGSIRLIGATTTAEYRRDIEKDPALERRFQSVWVEEPTRDEAVEILCGLRARFEEHHGIQIEPDALEVAVDLSIRYIHDFRLPDKAIDLMDQACAMAMLRSFSRSAAKPRAKKAIDRDDVAAAVAERCKLPVAQLAGNERERLLRIEATLDERVKGQSQAISAVADAVRVAKPRVEPNGKGKPRVVRDDPGRQSRRLGGRGTGRAKWTKRTAKHGLRGSAHEFKGLAIVGTVLGVTPHVSPFHHDLGFDRPMFVPFATCPSERAQRSAVSDGHHAPGFVVRLGDLRPVRQRAHSHGVPRLRRIFDWRIVIVVWVSVGRTYLVRRDVSRRNQDEPLPGIRLPVSGGVNGCTPSGRPSIVRAWGRNRKREHSLSASSEKSLA